MNIVPLTLDQAQIGQKYRVLAILEAYPGQAHWFYSTGVIPGELIQVKIKGLFADSNRVVCVGDSVFGLRQHECECVRIEPV